MNKKVIGLLLGAVLVALSFSVEAQQPKKVPRIGYLTLGAGPAEPEVEFKQRLRDLG